MKNFIIALSWLLFTATVFAWEAYDYKKGCDIDVKKEDGDYIEFYDHGDQSYHHGQIQGRSHSDGDGEREIEVYDYVTGKKRNFRIKEQQPALFQPAKTK